MDGAHRNDRPRVGEAAAELPWLCPPAATLVRLTDEPLDVDTLPRDAGLVSLALRYVRSTTTIQNFSFDALSESVVPEAAARLLEKHTPHAAAVPDALTAYSQLLADRMRRSAEADGYPHPLAAAAVGLLAPIGWIAVAAVDPSALNGCLEDGAYRHDPPAAQRRAWGHSHDEIARRVLSKWRVPGWLADTVSTLPLTLGDAVRCGADPELARFLRTAVEQLEAERVGVCWLRRAVNDVPVSPLLPAATGHEDPRRVRLLPRLLRAAARDRRHRDRQRQEAADREVDRLRQTLGEMRDDFDVAVRDAKLSGLAELAAGAGHEINNPLAVISGHAQRLRKGESDPDRGRLLDSILRQSSRISEIVRELMQYARPTTPRPAAVEWNELARKAAADVLPQASVKGVRLTCESGDPVLSHADGGQVRRALDAVIKNAVEATAAGGEVRVTVAAESCRVRIAVEDTGPGPTDAAVPHLFDPFYSGRSAGRGRGLGLATAWRLVNLNGGELTYSRRADGPTRFELDFPTIETPLPALRLYA